MPSAAENLDKYDVISDNAGRIKICQLSRYAPI